MNSQDLVKIGHKARRETEAFINHHLNDQAKGWPILCHCGSSSIGYRQEQQIRRRDAVRILLTK